MKTFVCALMACTVLIAAPAWAKKAKPTIEVFDPYKTDEAIIPDTLVIQYEPKPALDARPGHGGYIPPRYKNMTPVEKPETLGATGDFTVTNVDGMPAVPPEPVEAMPAQKEPEVVARAIVRDKPITPLQYSSFQEIADQAVMALIKQDPYKFMDLVSPNMKQHFGEAKIVTNTLTQLLPYFRDFRKFGEKATISRTRDAWGNEGYSFYQTFETKSGQSKNFLIQIINENRRLVVANITPDMVSPYRVNAAAAKQ